MSTLEKMRSIFYSGSYAFTGDSECINEIAFLVDNDYLTVKEIEIATKEEYRRLLNKPIEIQSKISDAAGGSLPHIVLKVLGGKYLESIGKIPQFEHEFCGYFPDVMSKDTIVECGHTQNADKLLTYFRQGRINQLIQIPYPSIDDEFVIGYVFTANGEIYDFLDFLYKEKHRLIREIIKRSN